MYLYKFDMIQCCKCTYPNTGTLILPRNTRDFRFSIYRFGFIQVLLHAPPQPPFISHGVFDHCIHSPFTSLPEHGFYIPNNWHWHYFVF